ncbi:MAG: GGDEF domain-containing protein [Sphingomonas taxi]
MPQPSSPSPTAGLALARGHAQQAMAFLDRHRLTPSPLFYALAWTCVTKPGESIASIVDALTDGGVRLSFDAAEDLANGLVADALALSREGIASQANRLTRSAQDTLAAASDLGRQVAPYAEGDSPLSAIARAMTERASRMEGELAASLDELQQVREELHLARIDADHDPLTGVLNRRGAEPVLAELERHGRYAVALCDIDRFKAVNDVYGHATGDNVLRAVSASLVDHCGGAIVVRWGGEEMLVAATDMGAEEMHALIDGARQTVAQRTFRLRQSGEPIGQITFSAGCASGDAAGITAAIERADALCYVAKGDGRNCVRR